MTLPIPSEMTATVGQILTATAWNSNVRDGINYLLNPPVFIGQQTIAQSIPNNAFTPVSLDTETVDSYGGHSTTTNNSRYTAQVAGWHLAMGRCGTAGSATGKRILGLAVNGTLQYNDEDDAVNTNLQTERVHGLVFLNVGDYVEIQMYQTTGASQNTTVSTPYYPSMTVLWVHA